MHFKLCIAHSKLPLFCMHSYFWPNGDFPPKFAFFQTNVLYIQSIQHWDRHIVPKLPFNMWPKLEKNSLFETVFSIKIPRKYFTTPSTPHPNPLPRIVGVFFLKLEIYLICFFITEFWKMYGFFNIFGHIRNNAFFLQTNHPIPP